MASSLGLFSVQTPYSSLVNSVASSVNSLSVIPAHTGPATQYTAPSRASGKAQPEVDIWDQWLQSTLLNTDIQSSLTEPPQASVIQPVQDYWNEWADNTLLNANILYSLAEPSPDNAVYTNPPAQAEGAPTPAPSAASPKPTKKKAEPAKPDNKPAKSDANPSKTDALLGQYEKAAGMFNSGGVASKGTLGEQELKDAQNQATKTGKSNDTLNFMVNNFKKYAGSDNKVDTNEMNKALGDFKSQKGEPTYNFVA